MARETRRVQLEVCNVPGMFRQAVLSCKSSAWLFLTLALLSSVYETAVERSTFLSGISFSSQNSNFSFQFSFDSKQPAKAPHALSSDGSLEPEGDSVLSRFLATFDRPSKEIVQVSQPEEASSGFVAGSDPASERDLDLNMNTHSPLEMSQHGGREGEQLNSGIEDGENQFDHKDVIDEPAHIDDEETKEKESPQVVEEGDEENLAEQIPEKNDGEDSDPSLPRLKILSVSNETKKRSPEFLADTTDMSFFTGKLLGGRGLDQGAMRHGGLTMLFMFLILAGALAVFLLVVGFQQAAVLGSVAYSVVSTHMGKRVRTRTALNSGFKSGVGRLMWLAVLHATLRGLQSLFFMKTLFGGVMEMEQVEQLVFRLSISPFAFLAPFRDVDATDIGMAVRIGLFIGLDYIFDGIAYCLYVVACWVTIMERDFWGLGALSRSWNLVKHMETQALIVRVLEAIICGRTCRWLLQQAMGQFPSAFVICAAQVYFLVLWLIFYISARSVCDGPSQFSYSTLEDFLDRFK